eukprot:542578-Hanusia_phi.AAC.1
MGPHRRPNFELKSGVFTSERILVQADGHTRKSCSPPAPTSIHWHAHDFGLGTVKGSKKDLLRHLVA